jgi:hypothetical protein
MSLNVPALEFRTFVPGTHLPGSAWIRKSNGHQMLYVTNPLADTAWHLAKTLRTLSPELVAAYKLHASCVSHQIGQFHYEVVAQWFKAIGEEMYGWWGPNARHVLPHVEAPYWPHEQRGNDPSHWRKVVELSADEWRAIAEQWAILLVPGLMEPGSPEDREAQAFFEARQDERDRAEYERLRTKFEGS